jgi:hypothetical protein
MRLSAAQEHVGARLGPRPPRRPPKFRHLLGHVSDLRCAPPRRRRRPRARSPCAARAYAAPASDTPSRALPNGEERLRASLVALTETFFAPEHRAKIVYLQVSDGSRKVPASQLVRAAQEVLRLALPLSRRLKQPMTASRRQPGHVTAARRLQPAAIGCSLPNVLHVRRTRAVFPGNLRVIVASVYSILPYRAR